jgi:hypothetical protein
MGLTMGLQLPVTYMLAYSGLEDHRGRGDKFLLSLSPIIYTLSLFPLFPPTRRPSQGPRRTIRPQLMPLPDASEVYGNRGHLPSSMPSPVCVSPHLLYLIPVPPCAREVHFGELDAGIIASPQPFLNRQARSLLSGRPTPSFRVPPVGIEQLTTDSPSNWQSLPPFLPSMGTTALEETVNGKRNRLHTS